MGVLKLSQDIVDGKKDNLRNYLKHKNENPNDPLQLIY